MREAFESPDEHQPAAEDALADPASARAVASDEDLERQLREQEVEGVKLENKLRRRYANSLLAGMGVVLVVADGVFIIYGQAREWQVPDAVMIAWLSTTVVQVVGVVLVVTRSLFPPQSQRR